MQFKFIEVLRTCQGHHSCVVGTRGELAEVNSILFADEELHAPKSCTGKGFCDSFGHALCFFQMCRRHNNWLKTFLIISAFLHMSDGRAKERVAVVLCNGEKRYFVVKLNEFFNNQFFYIATASCHSVVKGTSYVLSTFYKRLSFTAR